MSLVERLRGIVAAVPARRHADPAVEPAPAADADAAAGVLGGEWCGSGRDRCLVVDRAYRPGHRHGRLTLVDHVLPDGGEWERVLLTPGGESAAASVQGRTLFIDLETTGLAGGAGTYAFLVGCAWFDGCTFRVRQLFMPSHAAERVLLRTLTDVAGDTRLVVSYNGKTFDLPLLETRFLFNRMETPFGGKPHLDMLHPARRLWKADEDPERPSPAGCRLSTIEECVCGHTRDGDVPGFEIPARYFHFVRTGDPRPLEGVLEHNRLDLLSLAVLTARAAQLVEDGPPGVRTAREAVGLGRLYERAGRLTDARGCFARAAGLDGSTAIPGDGAARIDALRSYALLCRRLRQYGDAASAWRLILDLGSCAPHVLREAAEALAVHHEHRLRDPGSARTFAMRSLPLQGTVTRRQALQHRLARLDRKLAEPGGTTAGLF